jgi:hypothetical protein
LNKRIAGYRNGLVSYDDNEFEIAVQGFFQVLVNTNTQEERWFKAPRHACSHHRLDVANTIKALVTDFGLKCVKGMPVKFQRARQLETALISCE